MRKLAFSFLTLLLTFSILSIDVYASDVKYSEQELNEILIDSGMPEYEVNTYDFDLKETIVKNSGENLEYVTSSTQSFIRNEETGELINTSNIITPLAAIPRSDLIFRITVFNGATSSQKQIYGNFEWLTTGKGPSQGPSGIKDDRFSIAIPAGWEIQSGSYGADMYKSFFNISNATWLGWVNDGTNGFANGGKPASDGYSLYGASWELTPANINYRYKGTTWFTMRKVNSSAVNRAIVSYMEAKSNPLGQFGVSLAWKALEVTYTPTSGSVNTANQDITWK
ncbi:hypothetical protein [Paenibacillus sp. FSL R7-0272]|uniref:hypothetical protein n=1 Tax=Paenibacillus sp. FSL R7-0272 TaxID=2921679 RepID=UPI0030EE14C3